MKDATNIERDVKQLQIVSIRAPVKDATPIYQLNRNDGIVSIRAPVKDATVVDHIVPHKGEFLSARP